MFRRAIIAGLGALGSELAQSLGRFAPRHVTLVDQDVLEPKNIARSAFWGDARPGEPKVTAAARALNAAFPATHWTGIAAEIADVSPSLFEQADVLLGSVDTDLARVEMAAIGARYALNICDAGLGGTSLHVGRVSWFPATGFPQHPGVCSACFACLLSARRRAALLTSWESESHACIQSEPRQNPAWSSAAITTRRIARLQALLAVRACARPPRWPARTLQIDFDLAPRVRRIHHVHSEECPFHGDEVLRGELFPRCSQAVCMRCGATEQTAARIGWLRRWGRCGRCGSQQQPGDAMHRGWPTHDRSMEGWAAAGEGWTAAGAVRGKEADEQVA